MTELRAAGHAVSARYDRRRARVVVALNTGVELTFPARLAEGLADAPPDALTDIEVSAAGLGLHWPKLDTDLYVPALLQGVFGSKQWMAQQLGAQGGRSRTAAKVDRKSVGWGTSVSVRVDIGGCRILKKKKKNKK